MEKADAEFMREHKKGEEHAQDLADFIQEKRYRLEESTRRVSAKMGGFRSQEGSQEGKLDPYKSTMGGGGRDLRG